MTQYALTVAGTVFAIVTLFHLSRLYFKYPLVIGSAVPIWANVVGLIISGALSFWMFYTLKMND